MHYCFVSDAEFDAMVADDELLEWAVVHRAARYGTPRGPVEEALAAGRPALLEIDLQGARQVRGTMPERAVRLPGAARRGTSWSAGWSAGAPSPRPSASRRLDTAREELAAEPEFDVTIVNHEVHAAAEELVALMVHRTSWPARSVPRQLPITNL